MSYFNEGDIIAAEDGSDYGTIVKKSDCGGFLVRCYRTDLGVGCVDKCEYVIPRKELDACWIVLSTDWSNNRHLVHYLHLTKGSIANINHTKFDPIRNCVRIYILEDGKGIWWNLKDFLTEYIMIGQWK